MRFACDDYLRASHQEGLLEVRAAHELPSGWYSSEVMAHAVTTTSMRHSGRVEYQLSLQPLHVNPSILHSSVGAVVNIHNTHWVALRSVEGKVWFLDGQELAPKLLTETEYKTFIREHKEAYPIQLAEDMSLSERAHE